MASRAARLYAASTHFCSCATASVLAIEHEPALLVALALTTSPLAAVVTKWFGPPSANESALKQPGI